VSLHALRSLLVGAAEEGFKEIEQVTGRGCSVPEGREHPFFF
jgi:hypothetical protein